MNDEAVGDRRTVIVLNKRYEIGRLLNAVGHIALGLGADAIDRSKLDIQDYRDADGGSYPHISYHPVIVLKADNGNHLRRLRHELEKSGLPFACFVDSMIEGGSPAQVRATAQTHADDLDYVAVCTFGPTGLLKSLTRRFRLFA